MSADGILSTISSFRLGDVRLRSGAALPDAELVYATYGRLNRSADNCVLLPTYYTGTHDSYRPWIGPGKAIDPDRFFIVIPNLFGNGLSTSPSHGLGAAFPDVSVHDNVVCQHRLLTEVLGVRRIALAAGWSLGAVQSHYWAAAFPDMVGSLLALCGAARCWPLNKIFLAGVRAALQADPVFADGLYRDPPVTGLRAFGRVYAGWAYSAAFFRDELYRQLGAKSLEAFLEAWEAEHEAWDANDLLAMLRTWLDADVGDVPGCSGDFRRALARTKARAVLMPCDRDAYFTVEENAIEAACMPDVELLPLSSPYGHCAGAPGRFPAETTLIVQQIRRLLGQST